MPASIRSALKQTEPFTSLEQEAFLTLTRLAHELNADYAALFRDAGITFTRYNVLRILQGAAGEPLACSEIGERMVTRDSDVTRLLDRLQSQGLATRSRDARDRRVVTASITAKGRRLLADLDEPVRALHRAQLGHLSQGDLQRLLNLLQRARRRP